MKTIFYTIACLSVVLAAQYAAAQAPDIEWKNVYSRGAAEEGTHVAQTADGGYIASGVAASFFWVFKLDAGGTQQWEKYVTSGTGLTKIYDVRQTSDGGYIAAGSDFTTGATDSTGNRGIRDFFLVKLDNGGNVSWMKCLGGSLNEEAQSVEQTADGGYIVAGYTSSDDSDVTGWQGSADYWVVKLDASGNITWQKTLGGASDDRANSVMQTADGGYIVAGYAQSKSGDVTGTHWGGSDPDVWVVKLDASGNIAWQQSYGGSGEDRAYAVRQTGDGGYIVAGSTTSSDGNVSGKHGTSHGNQDYWVIKLDASGSLTWQKCLGGTGNDIAYSVRQTSDSGYIVAGTASSGDSTDSDISGYHGHTGSDYWVVKLDASGNISWQKCLGGSGTEDARSIEQTSDGGYIVMGSTMSSPDGDVNETELLYHHVWIVKLKGTGGSGNGIGAVSGSDLTAIYPNPAGDRVTVTNIPAGSVLSITDMTGKLMYRSAATHAQETIRTAGFANGVYIVQLKSEGSGRVAAHRLVVNR